MNKQELKEGIRDGLPICLGYISVSMAFGLTAVKSGLPLLGAAMVFVFGLFGL